MAMANAKVGIGIGIGIGISGDGGGGGGGGSPRYIRSRIGNACDECKARKVKCDGAAPCGYCKGRQRGDTCRYSAKRRRRSNNKGSSSNNGDGMVAGAPATPPTTIATSSTATTTVNGTGGGVAMVSPPTTTSDSAPSLLLPGDDGRQAQQQQRYQSKQPGRTVNDDGGMRRQQSSEAGRGGGGKARHPRAAAARPFPSQQQQQQDTARRPYSRGGRRTTNSGSQQQQQSMSETAAAEDETEVPREARLLRDARGKLIFIGDCAPLSFFQSVRKVVTSRVNQDAFAPQTSRFSVLENAPPGQHHHHHHHHHQQYHEPESDRGLAPVYASPGGGSGGGGGGGGGMPPLVPPEDVASAVSAYLATTAGMVDLFEDDATLLDDMLAWADRRQQQQQQQQQQQGRHDHNEDDDGSASTVRYLVLAIGRLADDEGRARDYFEHARARAHADLCGGDPSGETVQAFVLITVFMLCSCQISGAFLFFGVAARAAYSVGLHRTEVNARFGLAVRRQRDNLWKSLRVVDLFLSTSMGRPPATSDVDCTVSYQAAASTTTAASTQPPDCEGGEGIEAAPPSPPSVDVLSASVQILLITETIVVEIYSRRKISLQLTEGISLQLRRWSDRWLQRLEGIIEQSGSDGSVAGFEAQVSGACQVLSTYFYSVMLVSRPFLMYELHRRLSDMPPGQRTSTTTTTTASTSGGGGTNTLPSARTKLADACIDAASLMVDAVLRPIGRSGLRHRAPMLVPWLFAASLVLGVGLLGGGFGRILERHARMSIRALDHFARTDGHAAQYSLIAQSLLATALEDLERRERQERLRRTESSSQLFGLVPQHDGRRAASLLGGGGGLVESSSAASSSRGAQRGGYQAGGDAVPAAGSSGGSTYAATAASVTDASSSAAGGFKASTDTDIGVPPGLPHQQQQQQLGRHSLDLEQSGTTTAVLSPPRLGDIDSAFLGLSESMLLTPDADYWGSLFGMDDGGEETGGGAAVNLFALLDAGGGIDLAHYF